MKRLAFVLVAAMAIHTSLAQQIGEYRRFHLEGRKQAAAGNFQAAVDSFTVALNIMPYYSAIYLDRAEARLQTKNYKGAARDFSHVIEKTPFKTFAFFGRGVAYYNLGEYGLAERDFRVVLHRLPNNLETLEYLQSMQNSSKAIDLAQPAVSTTLPAEPTESDREAQYRKRERERDWLIWGYAVPWAIWTTTYLIWH